jgi:hypothetical protein
MEHHFIEELEQPMKLSAEKIIHKIAATMKKRYYQRNEKCQFDTLKIKPYRWDLKKMISVCHIKKTLSG